MKPAALSVYFGELLKPRLGLSLRVAEPPGLLFFYQCFEAFSNTFWVFEKSGNELPHRTFEPFCSVRFAVSAGLVAFSAVFEAAVVGIPRRALCTLDRVGNHTASARAAAQDTAGELPVPSARRGGLLVVPDCNSRCV